MKRAITIILFGLTLGPLAGCDVIDDVKDQLDTRGSNGDASGDAVADTSSAQDTVQPLNATVTMTAQLHSITANGSVFVEGNFTWNASGESDLRVDIEIKTQVSYPDWTALLSNQDPADVGSAEIHGPDTRFNFRAVTYRASAPDQKAYSDIITIQ